MIKSFLLFSVLAFATVTQAIFAQSSLEGTTLNAESGEPLPYVNIGIPARGTGTVSDGSGRFSLTYAADTDSVIFSAIGFETAILTAIELLKTPEIRLTPAVYEMEDVVVTGTLSENSDIYGHRLRRQGDNIGFGSTQLGTQIGARIEIRRPVQIQSAHFMVNRAGADSMLFRVNVYSLNEGLNGQNLLPENVIVEAPSEPGVMSVDLEPYDIIVNDDVLLSLEWIEAVNVPDDELQNISFRAARTGRNPNMLLKSTSHAPFRSYDDLVPYRLGFYLTGSRFRESD
ncbi:carboxypeptidase-like regulatory domain-containing protein [Rhodohalobacter mucosus]|nr:carboxypeptidase-like regulatory domain-containing protein [Rhodohalobacter mucosus]